jgi:hypothetical protein
MDFLRDKTTVGCVESRCEEYLNGRIFRRTIHLDSGDDVNELSIFQPVGSLIIQQIIDDHQDLDNIHLRRPPPKLLPLTISKISDDDNSYIIPSETLIIDAILSRAPEYILEAIICKINQREVIFMKNLPTNEWYYYQENHQCEPFNENLNENLNRIIRSTSTNEQKRLLKSAHFLISMVFYNAVKYIYKQKSQ